MNAIDALEFRVATARDVDSYIRVMKAVESPTMLVETDPEEIRRFISETRVYKIYHEDVFVGITGFLPRTRQHAYITEVAIHPKYEGRGIGTAALITLLGILVAEKFTSVGLVTHPDNERALRMYNRRGFKVTGRVENYEASGKPRLVLGRKLP